MSSIEFPFGLEDLDKVFAVTDFLANKDQLIKEFTPEVQKSLVKKGFFTGHFRVTYDRMFDELITDLIRKQVREHFRDFTPEEILLVTDTDFLKMIAPEYFDQDIYSKEGNNDKSTDSLQ